MIDSEVGATFECDDCHNVFSYLDVGYDGPKDRSDHGCHPFMEWVTLCRECEEKAQKTLSL